MKRKLFIMLIFLILSTFSVGQDTGLTPSVIKGGGMEIMVFPYDIDNKVVWGPRTLARTYAYDQQNGMLNTEDIVARYGNNNLAYAANICKQLAAYDYSDWYLPSIQELKLIYEQRNIIGGFSPTTYWSSTDWSYSAGNPYTIDFSTGNEIKMNLGRTAAVRCVRKPEISRESRISAGPHHETKDVIAVARYRINDSGLEGLVFASQIIGIFNAAVFNENFLSFAAETIKSSISQLGIEYIISGSYEPLQKPQFITICFPVEGSQNRIEDIIMYLEYDRKNLIPLGYPGTLHFQPQIEKGEGPWIGKPGFFVKSSPTIDTFPYYTVAQVYSSSVNAFRENKALQTVGVVAGYRQYYDAGLILLAQYEHFNYKIASGTGLFFIPVIIPSNAREVPSPGSVIHVYGQTRNLSEIEAGLPLSMERTFWDKVRVAKFILPERVHLLSGANMPSSKINYDQNIFSFYYDSNTYEGVVVDLSESYTETGVVKGSVIDAINGQLLSNILITVSKENEVCAEFFTNSEGFYDAEIPVGEDFLIEFKKEGYLPVTYNGVEIIKDEITFLETVMQIDDRFQGTGSLSGKFIDALMGEGIGGVQLILRRGINTHSGDTISESVSEPDGSFHFSDIPAGNYTIQAVKESYITTFFSVLCIGNRHTEDQNLVLSTELQDESFRIVLTWGVNPLDLDSHLTSTLDGISERYHVFYQQKIFSLQNEEIVSLDFDVTNSYGPETITIRNSYPGHYQYSVHNYSNRNKSFCNKLSRSNARVSIYKGTQLLQVFNAPSNSYGTLWTVFEMFDNQIKPINQISYESNSSAIR